MGKYIINLSILFFFFCFSASQNGCSDQSENPEEKSDIWDIDKNGIPKFVDTEYIELGKIYRISKFRSSVGHDYSDAFEECRSMKHYFEPKSDVDWSTIKIYSPVTGKITRVDQEWAGTKLEIVSEERPAFRFSVFHIITAKEYKVDDSVISGEQLGTHAGNQTMSDIAVLVNDPTRQGRMISYFDVMTDALFDAYVDRGAATREDFIISKTLRDANPLTCNGDVFTPGDQLENWFTLK